MKNDKTPKYCNVHKLENMVVVVSKKKCRHDGCNKIPIYNIPEETKPAFCQEHKTNDMIDVIHPKCLHQNCNKRPTYNYQNEIKPLYCSEHKLDKMNDITHKKCIHEGCNVISCFNYDGETKALYCKEHKLDGMIYINKNLCEFENCKISASCNFIGMPPKFCGKHKLNGMICIRSDRCIYDGCLTISNFNFEGETIGIYCSVHKLPNMIDLTNKVCIYHDCKTQPSFNYKTEKKALYCFKHKLDDMINVICNYCNNQWCGTRVSTNKYDGYCLYCFINMFPEKPVTRNYKTKEYSVVEFIKENFKDITWITDKKIQDGCSRRRPDLMIDLGYQIMIIEVDENQHEGYKNSCENKRLMEISQDLGFRPIIFIRFNPDDYIKNKINITSCWTTNGNGLCVLKKNKQKEWNDRLLKLKEHIKFWLNTENISNKTINVIKLFYDE